MPPKLLSDDKQNVVIRPLAYCKEKDIESYAVQKAFPIIPCDLCGSQPNLQRQLTKEMLQDWDAKHPGRIESIFRSITNVKPSQLADRKLFDFESLSVDRADEIDTERDEQVLNWMPKSSLTAEVTSDMTAS